MRWLVQVFALLFFMPVMAHASVVINEIAWMGNETSANDEWIELYNSGSTAVDVDGWVLDDGMNLSVILTGSIAAGSYVVLERTDDSSAPGSAFMVYTGALANTGATLTLRDAGGATHDVVAGGEDWESIGGDNTTKETAQLTVNGWITAPATPGKKNAEVGSEPDDNEQDSGADEDNDADSSGSAKKNSSASKKEDRVLTLPGSLLSLDITMPEVVYINQEVTFEAEPSGLGPTLTESLTYRWNFGDMATGKGKETTHTYQFPGEYIVTVWAGFKRQEQIARRTVTVLPVKFSITKNLHGDIQIHNDSPYEVDVSNFVLVDGSTELRFPLLSFIPERGTITIPKEKLGPTLSGKQIQLHDQARNLLAGYAPSSMEESSEVKVVPTVASAVASYVAPPLSKATDNDSFTFRSLVAKEVEAATTSVVDTLETGETLMRAEVSDESAATPVPATKDNWNLLGLAAVALLGIFGVYAGTQKSDQEG